MILADLEPDEETKLKVTKQICAHAIDLDDALLLMAVLGLIEDKGQAEPPKLELVEEPPPEKKYKNLSSTAEYRRNYRRSLPANKRRQINQDGNARKIRKKYWAGEPITDKQLQYLLTSRLGIGEDPRKKK